MLLSRKQFFSAYIIHICAAYDKDRKGYARHNAQLMGCGKKGKIRLYAQGEADLYASPQKAKRGLLLPCNRKREAAFCVRAKPQPEIGTAFRSGSALASLFGMNGCSTPSSYAAFTSAWMILPAAQRPAGLIKLRMLRTHRAAKQVLFLHTRHQHQLFLLLYTASCCRGASGWRSLMERCLFVRGMR